MTQPLPFQQLLPGLAQLQSLMQGAFKAQQSAGHAAPLGGWMQPALTQEQIESRIGELRTVLFWLEQNVHAVKATIEAMEVQRLTFSALESMNVNMGELAKTFRLPDMSSWAAAMPAAMAPATQARPQTQAAVPEAPASPEAPADRSAFNPSAWLQPLSKAFAWPKTETGGTAPEGAAGAEDATPAPARSSVPAHPAPAAQPDAEVPPPPAGEAAGAAPEGSAATAAMGDALAWWSTATRQFQALANSALQNHASAESFLEASQRAQAAMSSGAKEMSEVLKTVAATPLKAAADVVQTVGAQQADGGARAKAKAAKAPKAVPTGGAQAKATPKAASKVAAKAATPAAPKGKAAVSARKPAESRGQPAAKAKPASKAAPARATRQAAAARGSAEVPPATKRRR